jgi:CsoR family transcriptional regulator, copper-sensing transcriptional repressor
MLWEVPVRSDRCLQVPYDGGSLLGDFFVYYRRYLEEAIASPRYLTKKMGLTAYTPRGYSGDMKQSIKKKAIRRLKIVEGQVRGLQRMVEDEKYCIDIINQSSAAKEALSGVEDLMLENHLSTHVVHQVKGGQEKKAVQEILKVYKLAQKKQ